MNKIWKRWQLFHATDFQSLMNPCFTFSRILGLFPYKINVSIFEASRSRYLQLTVIICVICIYELARIYLTSIQQNFRTNIPEKIQDICYCTLESFIIITSSVLSGRRIRLLQTILEVSSKLPPKSYAKLSKWIHTKDIFGSSLIIIDTLQSFLNFPKIFFEEEYGTLITLTRIMEGFMNLQMHQMNMLYINCVCILKACFKRIDDNLINLRELMTSDKLHLPRSIYYKQRNSLLLKKLKTIQKQYLMVSNTVQMLNVIFSPQLLATIAIAFIEITFELYVNMVQWHGGLSIDPSKQIYDTFLMSYLLHHIINIILIVLTCETSQNQATKINTTVYEVLNSTSDKQIKKELYLFSLQILHSDNTFSAKGLTVNATLLTTMVGTITTYLLILIQFLIASHSCDGKSATNVNFINFTI